MNPLSRIPSSSVTSSSSFLASERRRLLPGLIPPLVHRINNALAVIQGLNEVGGAEAEAEVLREEFQAARGLLARLSSFARDQPEVTELFDLRDIVGGVADLLRPFAESVGVRLELREPLQAAVLCNNPLRVEQLLVVIVANELAALAEGDGVVTTMPPSSYGSYGSPRPKMSTRGLCLRLALRQAPGRTVVTLVRPRIEGQDELPHVMSEAARWADENAAALYMRTLGAVTCYRFVFASVDLDGGKELEPGFVVQHENLMLLEGDGPLCELIKTVCTEAGYKVTTCADKGFDPATADFSSIDLVLFDTDLELRRPGLLSALEARLAQVDTLNRSCGLLLLGEALQGAGSSSTPRLPKPFRPHELMSAVSRQLQQPSKPTELVPTAPAKRPAHSR